MLWLLACLARWSKQMSPLKIVPSNREWWLEGEGQRYGVSNPMINRLI